MGCWNETCVLTRTPITAGSPVAVLQVVTGLHYMASESYKTSLLLGLPLQGRYDDYGGIEDVERPELQDQAEQAFRDSGLYRTVPFERRYSGTGSRHIASSDRTLWGLDHSLKHLFYDEVGLLPSEVDSYDEDARAKLGKAFTLSQAALQTLGQALAQVDYAAKKEEQDAQLHALIAEAFGQERAWAAYDFLAKNGLFSGKRLIFMHAGAYHALNREFGARLAGRHGGPRQPVRELLKARLAEWLLAYDKAKAEQDQLFATLPPAVATRIGRRATLLPRDGLLQPMTRPWQVSETPLRGHYWDTAEPQELLALAGEDAWLDYFVFQWARPYMRVDLVPATGGSQNEETVLLQQVTNAVHDQLRATKKLRTDFDGYVGS